MSDASGLVAPPRKGRAAIFVAAAIAVVLVVLLVILFTRKSADQRSAFDSIRNKPAPPIAGQAMDGSTYDIDKLRGRWIVVNFFATWCVPCQIEHPELLKFAQEHEAAGDISLVGVVFQDDPSNVRDYLAKNGDTWPVLLNDDGRIALDYGVTAVPESVLIDPAGIVRDHFRSGVTQAQLDEDIATLTEQLFPNVSTQSASS